jgi:dTDP-4-dehydrorhamnose 3,5-epimerase
MEIHQTPLEGLLLIQPRVFEDERGYFYESWNREQFIRAGITADFVQDNQSLSQRGVLRGLHFQHPPYAQTKLIRVITGAVLDFAVDIRKNSKTFGQHYAVELNAINKTMLYIPEGFAHGFLTLENDTIFAYKCAGYYQRSAEDCLLWNDPALNINWPDTEFILSDKDKQGRLLKDLTTPF